MAASNSSAPKSGADGNSKATPKNDQNATKQKDDAPSEQECRQEASKAAKKSLELQKQARELTQAAAGAGDPEERQKLLNQALTKSIEAESFGKTAKYLQSGTFQGMLAGGGLGTGVGVGLGTLTGTLVGGVSSVIFGGLGSGIGSAVGAIHGPWFKPGEALGNGIRKITGDLPGWKATDKQNYQLEKMIGQVNEQDRPSDEDLEAMTVGDGLDGRFGDVPVVGKDGVWTDTAKSYVPSMPWSQTKSSSQDMKDSLQQASNQQAKQGKTTSGQMKSHSRPEATKAAPKEDAGKAAKEDDGRRTSTDQRPTRTRASSAHARSADDDDTRSVRSEKRATSSQPQGQAAKKKPRKLEPRQQHTGSPSTTSNNSQPAASAPTNNDNHTTSTSGARKPRKLESRNPKAANATQDSAGANSSQAKRRPQKLDSRPPSTMPSRGRSTGTVA